LLSPSQTACYMHGIIRLASAFAVPNAGLSGW
jgi:hypothetical protein